MRDLFRGKKKLLLEYARSTCDTKSEGTPVERYTPPRTETEVSETRREKLERISHLIKHQTTFDQNLFRPRVSFVLQFLILSRWILPREIHILLHILLSNDSSYNRNSFDREKNFILKYENWKNWSYLFPQIFNR